MGLCSAFGAVLFAVAPRYPDGELRMVISRRERFSWPGVLGEEFDPHDFSNFMKNSSPDQMVSSIAGCNAALSNILMQKYRALKYGFFGGGVALSELMLSIFSQA